MAKDDDKPLTWRGARRLRRWILKECNWVKRMALNQKDRYTYPSEEEK